MKIHGPTWMGFFERRVPYPLRAAKVSIDFTLFPWWKPEFHYKKELTEEAKRNGSTIWYVRWLWVQVSFSRWL